METSIKVQDVQKVMKEIARLPIVQYPHLYQLYMELNKQGEVIMQSEPFSQKDPFVQIPKEMLEGTEHITMISHNMIVHGEVVNGVLTKTAGKSVQAESIEMNTIKVLFADGHVEFYELGDKVKWIEVEL
jgi:hypothetical protein